MDRLRWALIGALWMAICVAAHEAYERGVLVPLLVKLHSSPDTSESPWWWEFGVLSYPAIAVFGIGVMVAGQRVMNRQGVAAGKPPAAEGRPAS